MQKLLSILLYIFGMILLASNTHAFNTLRCNDRLVSLGDYKQNVNEVCGPPTFIDTQQEVKTVKTYQKIRRKDADYHEYGSKNGEDEKKHKGKYRDGDRSFDRDYRLVNEQTFLINIEEWTYNFGSSSFIQTLVFENDQLASIIAGSYGFDKVPNNESIVEKGDSKAVVMMKYGQPTYEDQHPSEAISINNRVNGDYLYVEELRKPDDEEE